MINEYGKNTICKSNGRLKIILKFLSNKVSAVHECDATKLYQSLSAELKRKPAIIGD
jgi:hypothetical protein